MIIDTKTKLVVNPLKRNEIFKILATYEGYKKQKVRDLLLHNKGLTLARWLKWFDYDTISECMIPEE